MNGSQLGGWVIVLAAGRTFVGQRKQVDGLRLSPVYELGRQLVQGPQGQMAIGGMCTPVLLFGGIDALDFPADSIVIPFTSLSEEERAATMTQIASAEKMRDAMRAANVGIVSAGPGVKLPPAPGGKR